MAAKLPVNGREYLLDTLLAADNANWRLGLYANDYTPTNTTISTDLEEATYAGYARQTPVFGAVNLNAGLKAYATAPQLTFAWSGPGDENTIYGYFVIEIGTNTIIFAERLGTPKQMAVAGDQLKITPTITLTEDS